MKNIMIALIIFLLSCSKSSVGGTTQPQNHAPLASLSATVKSTNPFTVDFVVTASDADGDTLTYKWDFGNNTTKDGGAAETAIYDVNKNYIIKVAVSDGKAVAVNVTTNINTTITAITVDITQQYQQMTGFGGFGARDVYWSSGPFTGTDFVNSLINDLGITILRDNIPTDFESVNDDADANTTNLANFQFNSLNDRIQYLKDMKAAGLQKLIVSIWSATPWMKTNNDIDNGTPDNQAPEYNPAPTSANNQLRTDMYDEYAERCVAYIKIIKEQTGLDIYAMSLQNEPRFSQFYESCVFNGEALATLIKVVGKRFEKEGLGTKIFMPEDVGWFDGINSLIQPILQDAEAMKYVDIIATHGYAFDGVTAGSADAQTWQDMYAWGATSGKPLWMTETSGFANDFSGAMDMSKAIYTALNHGNISAWVFWTLSTSTLDNYSLMSSSGTKSKRYYSSKNFYKYIRPGAYRVKITAPETANIFSTAFTNATDNSQTIVLINDNTTGKAIKITGAGLFTDFNMYVTSAADDCKDYGVANIADGIFLPANAIVTLYKKN
ncbi:MAG: PKD domain-containing protein [Panacibacter sp.]